jgi:hypothetical protein
MSNLDEGDRKPLGLPEEGNPLGLTDRHPPRIWLRLVAAGAVALSIAVAVGIGVWALNRSHDTATSAKEVAVALKEEGTERRDQNCLIFEGEHLRDVRGLRTTYAYLAGLTREELRTSLSRLLLVQLSTTEERAKDRAPAYCDEPGYGNPEPDPVIPKRPAKIDRLLRDLR